MAYRKRFNRSTDSIGRITYGIKVNHLPQDMSEADLCGLFQQFGTIANVSLKSGSGESYAFVNFHSNSCAHEAVREMNGRMVGGRRINCKVQVEAVSESRTPSVGEYTVKVTSVPKSTTEAILTGIFGFGNPNCIQNVKIVPCSTGFTYNYAYVNYFHQSDADRAVAELDQGLVNGCVVGVKLHSGQVSSPLPESPMQRVASYSGGHAALSQPGSPSLASQRHMSRAISQPAFGGSSRANQRQYSPHSGSPRQSSVLQVGPGVSPVREFPIQQLQPPIYPTITHSPFSGRNATEFSHSSRSMTHASHGVQRVSVSVSPRQSSVFQVVPGVSPVREFPIQQLQPPIYPTITHSPFSGRNATEFSHSSRSMTHASHGVQRVSVSVSPMRQASDPVPYAPRVTPNLSGSRALSYPGNSLSSSFPPRSFHTGGSDHQIQRQPSQPAFSTASGQPPCSIKVSMYSELSSEDIEDVFSRFGTIKSKPIIRGGNPYYVFVNFLSPKAAADACSLHNSKVKGVGILVRTHTSQKQQAGVALEPREVRCTPLAASILSSRCKEELASLESQHQVRVTPKHNCIKVWGLREQVSAVELCLQSLLERVEGEVTVKECELPSHSVPLFEQDSAVEEIRKIEATRGVEFRVLRAAPSTTPVVDLASFCQDVKQVFVPAKVGTSTAVPTCSELALYLSEKRQSSPPPTPTETAVTTWLWGNDSGSEYISYTGNVSSKLSSAFLDDPTGCLTLKIGSYKYTIDFATMTQTNTSSGRSRPIRQVTGRSGQRVQWFYTDDRRESVPYTAEQSEEIEQMCQSSEGGNLVVRGKVYNLDFANMKQCNVATLNSRKIERQVTLSSESEEESISNVERVLTLQTAGLPESLDPSIEELRGIVQRSTIQKVCSLNRESSKSFKTELMKNMNKYFVTAELVDDCLRLKGTPRYVERVHLIAEQEKLSNREQMMDGLGGELQPPPYWTHQTEEVMLVVVKPSSEEWKTEVAKIQKTLRGATIVKLERIQNKWLWERYSFAKKRMLKTKKGHVNEKHLFHGTRSTEPKKVFRSEKGVDFRFSREGLWGTGAYFAVNALYSDTYAYSTPGGIDEKQMFICQVLTGDCYDAETNTDRSLRQPPLKPGQRAGSFEERYDSVGGITNRSYVYVVYDHEKVYPAYLVTYRR